MSLFAAELEEPKIGMRGKGLTHLQKVLTPISLQGQAHMGAELFNPFPNDKF